MFQPFHHAKAVNIWIHGKSVDLSPSLKPSRQIPHCVSSSESEILLSTCFLGKAAITSTEGWKIFISDPESPMPGSCCMCGCCCRIRVMKLSTRKREWLLSSKMEFDCS